MQIASKVKVTGQSTCANHPTTVPEGHSSAWPSQRLTNGAAGCSHTTHAWSRIHSITIVWSRFIWFDHSFDPIHRITIVCILIGCWPWSIFVSSRQQTCFSFFMPPKSFNKPFEFLLYKTNDHTRRHSHATRLRLVSYVFVLYTLWRHLWSIKLRILVNVI